LNTVVGSGPRIDDASWEALSGCLDVVVVCGWCGRDEIRIPMLLCKHLCGGRHGDFTPDREAVGHHLPIQRRGQAMPAGSKMR
jgi:hypothetical protein